MEDEITTSLNGKGKPLFVLPPNATMLQAALIYADCGWPVFPCWPINKRPATFNGFKDATIDPERIRRCWQRYPNLMIGVPMGSWSGVFAVDLDRKQGHEDGVASWAKFTAEHGGVTPTLSSTTPSSGQHHLYRHVEGVRSFELDRLAPGIEIKGEGGYIVVPPSFCTDPKFNGGAPYKWNEPLLTPADAPDWLVAEILAMAAPPNFTPPPGHITKDELRACLTRTDMASGFANRFLFALVRRSKLLPFGGNLSDSEIQHLGEKLKNIVDTVKGDPLTGEVPPPQVTMTDAAKAVWEPIYRDMSVERPGLLGAITARGEPQILRLALIYALLDKAGQIDLPHLQAGLAVWNYCEASAAHIFGATLGDEVADAILRALKNAGTNGMNRTFIRELFGGHQSKARTDAALALLVEKGLARVELRTGTKGRPLENWYAR